MDWMKADSSISEKAMQKIIHEYTREAGVRALERRIGDPCAERQTGEILEKNRKNGISITERNLEKYLGKSIYDDQYEGQ